LRKNPRNLVWIDLETTGLDPETSAILEIATIVTDGDLNVLAEGPDFAIHHPESVLEASDPWCIRQHRASGLFDTCRRSDVSLRIAEERTLAAVRRHCLRGRAPLCGNSVCFDRRFLMRHMTTLNEYLNFRNVDVSSIRELAARWFAGRVPSVEKESKHRALCDIRESIEELRLYRKLLFREDP